MNKLIQRCFKTHWGLTFFNQHYTKSYYFPSSFFGGVIKPYPVTVQIHSLCLQPVFYCQKKSPLFPIVKVILSWTFLKNLTIKLMLSLYNMFSEPFSEKNEMSSLIHHHWQRVYWAAPLSFWSPVCEVATPAFQSNLIRIPPSCVDISMDITLRENMNDKGG